MADTSNDITLKMKVDASDASSTIDKFTKATEKAFSSSDKKTQSWGNSLNKVTQQMQKTVDKMHEMENTKVPTERYTELQNKLEQVKSNSASAHKELEQLANARVQTTQFSAVQDSIRTISRDLENARIELGRFQNLGVTSGTDYNRVNAEVQNLTNQLTNAVRLEANLIATNQQYEQSDAYDRQAEKCRQYENVIQSVTNQLKIMESTGTATQSLADAHPEQYAELENRLTNLSNQGNILSNSIYNAGNATSTLKSKFQSASSSMLSSIKKLISSGFNRLKDTIKGTSDVHGVSFKKMLTSVLKYGFGIRSIFLLYKKLRTELSKGLKSLGSDFPEIQAQINNLMNSFTAFKASLTSAFQPIFSYVVPALVTLIDYLTTAMNALANFFALLTGQGFYYKATKANNNYANSVSNTGKAAKEANKELGEYDKLVVINQDNTGGGSGGGGGASGDAGYQWEKVNTTASSIADKVKEVLNIVKKAWDDSDVLPKVTTSLGKVKSLLDTIGQTFYDVFTEGYGYDWLLSVFTLTGDISTNIGDMAGSFEKAWNKGDKGKKLVEDIYSTLTNINSTIDNISVKWSEAWNSKGVKGNNDDTLGDETMDSVLTLMLDISGTSQQITAETSKWSSNLNFVPLLTSINRLLDSTHKLLQPIRSIGMSIYTQLVLPLTQHLLEVNLPEMLKQSSETLDDISKLLTKLEPKLKKLMPYIEQIGESTLDAGFGLIADILKSIGGEASFGTKILEGFDEIWEELKPHIEDVKKVLKPLEPILEPIKNFINSILGLVGVKIGNPFTELTANIKKAFTDLVIPKPVQKVMDFFNTFSDISKNLPDDATLVDVGKYLIEGLLNGIEEKLLGIGTWVSEKFQTIVNAVKDFFGIHSPSTVFADIGGDLIAGLKKGLTDSIANIKQWLQDNIISKITGAWDTIKQITVSIGGKINDTFTAMKEKFDAVKDKTAEIISDAKEKTKNVIGNLKEKFDAIKDKTATIIGDAKNNGGKVLSGLESAWKTLKNKTVTVTGEAKNNTSQVLSALQTAWNTIKKKTVTVTGKAKNPNSTVLATLKNAWSTIVSKTVTLTANIKEGATSTVKGWLSKLFGGKKMEGGVYLHGVWKDIPQYASGTSNAGSLFVAGEAGPEVVGHIGGRTEVLNQSQLASVMKSAVMSGMVSALNSILPLRLNFDLSALNDIPAIVLGQILPVTDAFMLKYEEQKQDLSDIKDLLEQVISLITANPDSSNNEPIMLQLDGRTIAEVVWDETEKRYKQTGRYNLRFS